MRLPGLYWTFLLFLFLGINGCNRSQLADSFAPDPRLTASGNPSIGSLPGDISQEIPVYQNATLGNIEKLAEGQYKVSYSTGDPINFVREFYKKELTSRQWEIIASENNEGDRLVARRGDKQVEIAPGTNGVGYVLSYDTIVPSPNPSASNDPVTSPTSLPTTTASPTSSPANSPASLPKSEEFLKDLVALKTIVLEPAKQVPGRIVTRGEYAGWLLSTYNKMYAQRPDLQIKLAPASTTPVFRDVPATAANFAAIQGLAEAGIIPSSLTGATTAVLFQPESPLTREQLVAWKIPLDRREALPKATLEAIQQTWGFQDAAKIDPLWQRAILADYQSGDRSNIKRTFGYTTVFQPKKGVSLAEVAAALWYFGTATEGISAREAIAANN
jgi:hypothetical protein